jgi:hypothetical protein
VRTLQNGVLENDKGVPGKDAGVTSVAIRPTDGRCVVAVSCSFYEFLVDIEMADHFLFIHSGFLG